MALIMMLTAYISVGYLEGDDGYTLLEGEKTQIYFGSISGVNKFKMLTDVSLPNPLTNAQNYDIPKYNNKTQMWENNKDIFDFFSSSIVKNASYHCQPSFWIGSSGGPPGDFSTGNWFPNASALLEITNFWIYGTDINGQNTMNMITNATRIYIFNTLNNAYCLYNIVSKSVQSSGLGYYCTVSAVCGAGQDIQVDIGGNPFDCQSQPFIIYFNVLNTDLNSNTLSLLPPESDNQVIAYSQNSGKFLNIYYTEGIPYIFNTTINGTLMTSAYVDSGNITFVNASATPPVTVTSISTVTDIFISQYDANGKELYNSLALEFASNSGVILPLVRIYNPTQRNKFFDFNVTMMLTSTVSGVMVIRLTVTPLNDTQPAFDFVNGEGLVLCPVVIQRLIDLTDIILSTLSNKDLLMYNVATSCWVNGKLGLSDLTNVNLSGLQTGDTLAYDSATSTFNNMPNKLINLLDVDNTGFSDKKILMYNQNTQDYDVKAYGEIGFCYNLSTDIQLSFAMPGRFKMMNGEFTNYEPERGYNVIN